MNNCIWKILFKKQTPNKTMISAYFKDIHMLKGKGMVLNRIQFRNLPEAFVQRGFSVKEIALVL